MPIYEFFCADCNTIFNFFARSANTDKKPDCPQCGKSGLERWMSVFSVSRGVTEDAAFDDVPYDEQRMSRAMETLAKEAGNLKEDDPRQAARLMRRLSDLTGVKMGSGMEEALVRMERGEDPEAIESQLGDALDVDPFQPPGKKTGQAASMKRAPKKDETLYDL